MADSTPSRDSGAQHIELPENEWTHTGHSGYEGFDGCIVGAYQLEAEALAVAEPWAATELRYDDACRYDFSSCRDGDFPYEKVEAFDRYVCQHFNRLPVEL